MVDLVPTPKDVQMLETALEHAMIAEKAGLFLTLRKLYGAIKNKIVDQQEKRQADEYLSTIESAYTQELSALRIIRVGILTKRQESNVKNIMEKLAAIEQQETNSINDLASMFSGIHNVQVGKGAQELKEAIAQLLVEYKSKASESMALTKKLLKKHLY